MTTLVIKILTIEMFFYHSGYLHRSAGKKKKEEEDLLLTYREGARLLAVTWGDEVAGVKVLPFVVICLLNRS